MGGQMSQRDEEFPVVLTVDESGVSVSPSWCLTAILLNQGARLDGGYHCHRFSNVGKRCSWLDVVASKLPPCHHVSYQHRQPGASTERRRWFLQARCQPSQPTVSKHWRPTECSSPDIEPTINAPKKALKKNNSTKNCSQMHTITRVL